MPTLRLTKEFRFEGAHALTGYDGKCRHIHGHSYILYVTVKGTPSNPDGTPKSGMLIDFTDLKQIVNDHIIDIFDHSLILRESCRGPDTGCPALFHASAFSCARREAGRASA
ncbi:MAG TPA: 6-pyruvoyl tetrahydropterin synthase family protein, partial [Candidatus Coprenecus merdigallinarum]|nr:6-pyruvoyl tetrahydropterin synthase family protein [Candidatus Coprenecus merdigallinarum]